MMLAIFRALQPVCICVLFGWIFSAPTASQEVTRQPEVPQGASEVDQNVVLHRSLMPPLLGASNLRFSPDGRYLLLQDAAGLFVISREPLRLTIYADALDAYPAQFSSDSKTISVVGRDLSLGTWLLANGKLIDKKELLLPAGCLDAQLVPGAGWLACLSPELDFQLYQSSDLKRAYSHESDFRPNKYMRIPVPLYSESAFSGPFGFTFSSDFSPFANRRMIRLPMLSSPDARFLLVNHQQNSFRLELPSMTKSNLPAGVRKHGAAMMAIQPDNRVLVLDLKKEGAPFSLSLTTGEITASPSFTADGAALATNPRYALLTRADSATTSVFDLEQNRAVDTPANLAADVYGDTLAIYNPEGQLRFYRLGDPRPLLGGRIPLRSLPVLRAAAVDPSLSILAIAVRGGGAIYDIATGKRLSDLGSFSGLHIVSANQVFWLAPGRSKTPPAVSLWDGSAKPAAPSGPVWTTTHSTETVPGAIAFLEYSFYRGSSFQYQQFNRKAEMAFQLRALDPATGRELWKNLYVSDPPIPFDDPQGDRLILAWEANSEGARSAAKHFPALHETLKHQKLKEQDSFFEVLDSLTGKPLGGALVQFGSGPSSFDSAFSCGPAIFLTKDQQRLSVFQLSDGKLIARLRGMHPAANGPAKRFVVDEGDGRLGFYDLSTGVKLAERRFLDGLAYFHFSENGDRLFVLTNHQEIVVLDVGKTIAGFPVTPRAGSAPENP